MEPTGSAWSSTGEIFYVHREDENGDSEILEFQRGTKDPSNPFDGMKYLRKTEKFCEASRIKRNEEWNHKLQRILREVNYKPNQ